jgi:cytochrome c peroxidase
MTTKTTSVLLILAAALAANAVAAEEQLRREAAARFGAIEAANPAARSAPQAELGSAPFWDAQLSGDGKTSCATCHSAQDWGADRRPRPVDARGNIMPRHAPTVFNALRQPMLRWLGDHSSGAELAERLITGPMGFGSKASAIERMTELGYLPAFRMAFPGEVEALSAHNYARALQAYQASLTTPAPFDRFLAGDDAALSAQQKAGLRAFVATGCSGCHSGPLFGGTTLQRFGVTREYWLETGSTSVDSGLYAITKKEEDRYRFRVPMLRNVARTAPYFHDGSVERLDDAVRVMAMVQLGRTLDDASIASIVAFLESLSGTRPPNFTPPSH